jgi:hypothetical protein
LPIISGRPRSQKNGRELVTLEYYSRIENNAGEFFFAPDAAPGPSVLGGLTTRAPVETKGDEQTNEAGRERSDAPVQRSGRSRQDVGIPPTPFSRLDSSTLGDVLIFATGEEFGPYTRVRLAHGREVNTRQNAESLVKLAGDTFLRSSAHPTALLSG